MKVKEVAGMATVGKEEGDMEGRKVGGWVATKEEMEVEMMVAGTEVEAMTVVERVAVMRAAVMRAAVTEEVSWVVVARVAATVVVMVAVWEGEKVEEGGTEAVTVEGTTVVVAVEDGKVGKVKEAVVRVEAVTEAGVREVEMAEVMEADQAEVMEGSAGEVMGGAMVVVV